MNRKFIGITPVLDVCRRAGIEFPPDTIAVVFEAKAPRGPGYLTFSNAFGGQTKVTLQFEALLPALMHSGMLPDANMIASFRLEAKVGQRAMITYERFADAEALSKLGGVPGAVILH